MLHSLAGGGIQRVGAQRMGAQKLHIVDLLHRNLLRTTGGHQARQGGGRRLQKYRVGGESQQGLRAALHVQHRGAVHQHHAGARLACRAVLDHSRSLARKRWNRGPAQRRTVRVRRVGRRQQGHRERAVHLFRIGALRGVGARAKTLCRTKTLWTCGNTEVIGGRTQQVHRCGGGELRRTQTLNKVAATH